jgi:hypothetical protein
MGIPLITSELWQDAIGGTSSGYARCIRLLIVGSNID